ncbi:hypothetical protein OPW32_16700 [Vibrio europaeus]|uniref:hypothetical protein n=1 Tax=Vibrio europaeus TaxID=300876 RepID=UPI00233FFF41|nr:hypothetical protein [Vibrio europaeus]MDC5850836.1 hypothetical protein [Vibrio europaeus]
MLFWTPELPSSLYDWLDSTTAQILCCEVDAWNCAGSSEFERKISDIGKHLCIPLTVYGEQVDSIIDTVWWYLDYHKISVEQLIVRNHKYRYDKLLQQVSLGLQPDLGIYDCVDMLFQIDVNVVLCIRLENSRPTYLKVWIDYIVRFTTIKIIILHPNTLRGVVHQEYMEQLSLPVLNKDCVLDACEHAVYRLTGERIERYQLDIAMSNSQSLEEFISIVQTATLYQCKIEMLLLSLIKT